MDGKLDIDTAVNEGRVLIYGDWSKLEAVKKLIIKKTAAKVPKIIKW